MTPIPAALSLRVNELFHDLEGEAYDAQHPEIMLREHDRWVAMLQRYVSGMPSTRTLLDLGCGTGFVSLLVQPHLAAGSTIICADISQTMLEISQKRLEAASQSVSVEKLKMQDERIALPDSSCQLVTMNSVLHHIPYPQTLLAEIERVLSPGGILIIGHEPNRRFHQHGILSAQAKLLHAMKPRRLAVRVLRRLGLYHEKPPVHDPMIHKINETLMSEHLIEKPLNKHEMSALIDIHSPTAGGLRKEEGFFPAHMLDDFPSLKVEAIETYNHLLKESGKPWLAWYERLLETLLPHDGSIFFLVARKQAQV